MKNLILFAAAIPALATAAPQPVSLSSNVMLEKTVVADGQTRIVLKAPDSVLPGDKLVFATSFRNVGPQPADRFVVTNPLPGGVAFAGDSSAGSEVSVDGGRSWGQLATLHVGQRAAQASDVTHLRWTLARIQPGASGTLKFRGIVR